MALGLLSGGTIPRAAAAPASQSKDATAPSYDMKAQSLQDLDVLHKQFVSLAEAIPADKFTWRPAPGVRSIGEVYLHIAGQNLRWASDLTTTAPPFSAPKGYEQSTTDKTKIIDQLNQSFAYAQAAVEKMANADFAKPMKKYGPDANAGDIVYLIVTHTHEHLGQSIAYARMNGVVPPWTAAQQAQQKKSGN
jgi:uncharacterized damage-inducible protein DinB